ncbi:MAG: hypothetical protein LUD77_07100, partial [Clostridiales bacterium]|nr:hypothetical protein [Clostridiales bacterium]
MALQALTIENSVFTIGDYTYSTSVKSSSVNTSVSVDGAAASNWRIHSSSSITVAQDCTVTIATKNPGGKAYSFAVLNADGTYTSVVAYDTSNTSTEGVEVVLNLSAGDVIYVMGSATNPEIYAINVEAAGSSGGGSNSEETTVEETTEAATEETSEEATEETTAEETTAEETSEEESSEET